MAGFWRGPAAAVAVALICGVAGVAGGAPAGAAPAPPRYLVIGDSLVWEAADELRFFGGLGGADVTVASHGGTALCDWLDHLGREVDRLDPDVVVLSFSGNRMSPCMAGRDGEPLDDHEAVRRYGFHVEVAMWVASRHGATVFWVGSPRAPSPTLVHEGVTELYRVAPLRWGNARFVDGGEWITPYGGWSETQPCLPFEPCTGPVVGGVPSNVVRAPDGAHFCPTGYPSDHDLVRCPQHSSGALRFALTILGAVSRRTG